MKNFFFVSFIFFTACNLGPSYKRISVNHPDKFLETESSNISLKNWWENFNDEELNFLVEKSINSNYDLKIAIERICESRSYYNIQKANLFPSIDLNASVIRQEPSKNFVETSSINKKLFEVGFDAIWEIDIFGKLRKKKESAFYDVESKQEKMRDVYVFVTSEVGKYYILVRYFQNVLDVFRKIYKNQKDIFFLTKEKFRSGLDDEIAVKEEEIKLKKIKEEIFVFKNSLKESLYLLAFLIGEYPEKISYLNKKSELPDFPEKLFSLLPSDLIRNRPDIREKERIVAKEFANEKVAFLEFFPTFSLIGDTSFLSNKFKNWIDSKSFSWTLGSLLKWPVINFGRLRANLSMSRSIKRQAILDYEKTILNAFKDVETSFAAYLYEKGRIFEIEKELKDIKRKIFLYQDRYRSGIDPFFSYLKEENIFFRNQIKYLESKKNILIDVIAIYKALGGGDWK